jgi:uncharacterized protein
MPVMTRRLPNTRRLFVAGAIVGAVVCLLVAPAAAHVTIDPPSVPKGSTSKLSFLVPNESATATTTKVQIVMPDVPNVIPGVSVEAKPGWKFAVVTQKLTEPIVTDDGTIDEVVRSVTWTAKTKADAIGDGEFGEFTIDADGIPDGTDELAFKAVQTYSDGTIERWVDPVTPDGPEAEHPTPILILTEPEGEATPTTAVSTTTVPDTTTTITASTQDDNARALGVIGIAVGAVALVLATGALMRKRRR